MNYNHPPGAGETAKNRLKIERLFCTSQASPLGSPIPIQPLTSNLVQLLLPKNGSAHGGVKFVPAGVAKFEGTQELRVYLGKPKSNLDLEIREQHVREFTTEAAAPRRRGEKKSQMTHETM